MSDGPRQYTTEEIRDNFLAELAQRVNSCEGETRAPTSREKLELLAFCFCCMLDGCGGVGFIVAQMPHEEQRKCREEGSNWYPANDEGSDEIECDIAGPLHELIHKYFGKAAAKEDLDG